MNEHPKAFIPAWLDDSGLLPAEFRLYCHLCRRADNSTGIAWPSYQTMIDTCGTSKSTARRCLESLVERGLIAKIGKPFGGSCRYRVLAPIVPPENRNSSTTGTIEAAPIVPPENRNSPSSETSIVPPEGQEGYPKKVIQGRLSNNMDHGDSLKLEVATKKPSSDELAESIYQEYPRKVGKSSALTAIKKSLKNHASEFLLERVKAYASAIGWKDRQFIPHPATWFNGGRFNDDPAEWEPPAQSSIPQPIETAETAEMMASLESVLQTMRPGWDTMLSYAERQAMMMNARCLLNVKPDGWASMKRYLAAKLPEGSPGYQPRSRLKFIENLPDVHGQAIDWDRKQRRCTPIPAPPVTPRATISRAELAEVFTKNGTSEPCNRSEP